EEEVTYENKKDGVTLAGTLTMPKTGGPHPTVLLIPGSGPNDRDETIWGHRVFLVLADHLTRQGIAVLRADDRGVGESTGDFSAATIADLARDACAGVEYLKTRPEIDARKIGLVGHSLGANVAPLAATQSPDVAFIVLMAGASNTLAEGIHNQCQMIYRSAGGLGRPAVVVAALLTAISPAMVFYSRYYIQEVLLVCFTFGAIISGYRYTQSKNIKWAIFAGISLGLMHATKETSVIAFGSMLLALLLTLVMQRRRQGGSILMAVKAINPWHGIAAVAAAGMVSVLFYSSFFTNAGG
ncbi:unnamed protein product, partial [marine sediment metagenome]